MQSPDPNMSVVALAAIYGLVELGKFVAHKRNGVVPRLTEQVQALVASLGANHEVLAERHKTVLAAFTRLESRKGGF